GGLLGLPDGTLSVRTYHPWQRVVKGPAAQDWAPLEAEARAFLSAVHGVPNDDRLPAAARDEIRALIYARLLGVAKKAPGDRTSVEAVALKALQSAIVTRKAAAAQKAIDQYQLWANSPCEYQPPAGFGFDPYNPGPACAVGGSTGIRGGYPRPPTLQQFT